MPTRNLVALDVGQKRIGVALADARIRIAVPYGYVEQSAKMWQELAEIFLKHHIDTIVVGYPRNQSGQPTQQTAAVERFVDQLTELEYDAKIVYQDESLTSVQAEARLGRVKDKWQIDAEAASIILQDYLETRL